MPVHADWSRLYGGIRSIGRKLMARQTWRREISARAIRRVQVTDSEERVDERCFSTYPTWREGPRGNRHAGSRRLAYGTHARQSSTVSTSGEERNSYGGGKDGRGHSDRNIG
jgi:hypothetical protein